MRKTCPLTPDLEAKILAAIRTGGFPHVAAEAFGVSQRDFKKWLRLGRNPKNVRYTTFAKNVEHAVATARLTAEMHTHQKDPKLWLRSGPGKETPASVGWTTFVRPQNKSAGAIDCFATPAFFQFLAMLGDALAPFPEALQAALSAIAAWQEGRLRSKQPLCLRPTQKAQCSDFPAELPDKGATDVVGQFLGKNRDPRLDERSGTGCHA